MKQVMKTMALAMLIVLMVSMVMPAAAVTVPDADRVGSITVAIRYQDKLVPGGSLTMYKVADLKGTDGKYGYVLTADMAGSGVELGELKSEKLAQDLADYVKANNIQGKKQQINDNGKATFAGLTTGVYLFIQEERAEGYLAADPFLVSVPMYVDSEYVYDVDASPKVALEPVDPTDPSPSDPTDPSPSDPTDPSPSDPTDPSTSESTLPPPPPPQTGQLNWPVPVLAVAGMVLVAIGWFLSRKKETAADEK